MNTFLRSHPRSSWPLGALSGDLFRDFDRAFRMHDALFEPARGVFPPVNLEETEEGYVLTAELPGVAPEDIDVSIEGSTVTLAGERKIEYAAGEGTSVHRRERQSGNFRRAFDLPAEIDLERARAIHKHGVLRLELPRSPALQPRQIAIETS